MLTVTTAATDLTIATIQQLRVAAGLSSDDDSKDVALTELGSRLAADVSTACKIASDGINPPTLRSEIMTDTYRFKSSQDVLILSRRFVSAITSIVENDVTLTAADYELHAESGLIKRLSGDTEICWPSGKIVVNYTAGFANVPPDLSGIVADEARLRLSEHGSDPLAKSVTTEIPDIETYTINRWVGDPNSDSGGPLSEANMRRLTRYINQIFG